jgi:hypothetical protein
MNLTVDTKAEVSAAKISVAAMAVCMSLFACRHAFAFSFAAPFASVSLIRRCQPSPVAL